MSDPEGTRADPGEAARPAATRNEPIVPGPRRTAERIGGALPGRQGLNLHIYPSEMVLDSPLLRISATLQETGYFSATHLVGIVGGQPPGETVLGEGRYITRLGRAGVSGSGLKRAQARLTWFGHVYARYRRQPVEMVTAHSVWTFPVAWALARRTGAALVYGTQELETETPTMTGVKQKVARAIERLLIKSAALVTCVNSPIATWYARTYGIRMPVIIRNMPEEAAFDTVKLREVLGLSDSDRIYIHTGRMTDGRHVEQILAAFGDAPASNHVVFLGSGELMPLVQSAAAANDNIHLLPAVAPERVVPHVAGADVSLCLIEPKALSYRLAAPNKLFEGLRAMRPVLCTDLPAAADLFGELWPEWHITDVPRELPTFIAALDDARLQRFADRFPGLPSWEDEIAPFLAAVATVLTDDPGARR